MLRVAVDILGQGARARLACRVASSARAQERGLEVVSRLGADEGMLFPFAPPRATRFHMGHVAYPIDVAFVEPDGRIARLVRAAQPGEGGVWGASSVGLVVETRGGWFARHALGEGSRVSVPAISVDAGAGGASVDVDLLTALVNDPGTARSDPADARLKGAPWAEDAGPEHGHEEGGGTFSRVSADLDALDVDATVLVPALLEGAARTGGLAWQPTVLNPYREQVEIGARDIARWLHGLRVPEDQQSLMFDAATDPVMLDQLGQGFIAANMAHSATLLPGAHGLMLTRRLPGGKVTAP